MSRVAVLTQWADRSGASITWSAPLVGEYTVTVQYDDLTVVASGTDAGDAAARAMYELDVNLCLA